MAHNIKEAAEDYLADDDSPTLVEVTGRAAADAEALGDREYHDFVQVLGGTTYILRRRDLPDPVEGLRSELMREHIERGVEALLMRVSAEGWEPVGSTDPNHLWLNGQVAYERRRGDLLGMKTHYNLSSVVIRCSRPKLRQPPAPAPKPKRSPSTRRRKQPEPPAAEE
jgi:hypothetical protein